MIRLFKEYTGKKDVNLKKIYVGDKVLHSCGWSSKGTLWMYHTIRKHSEDNTIQYLLGKCYNIWGNGEVELLSKTSLRWLKRNNIHEDTFFATDSEGNIISLDLYFYGTEEKAQEAEKYHQEQLRRLWFGEDTQNTETNGKETQTD